MSTQISILLPPSMPSCSKISPHRINISPYKRNKKTGMSQLKKGQPVIEVAQCERCRKTAGKMEKMRAILGQIKSIMSRNMEIKEEIQLLVDNFSYIIELAGENLEIGIKECVVKVLHAKETAIYKQAQVIKRLQAESQVLIEKADAGIANLALIDQLRQKISFLEAERTEKPRLALATEKKSKSQSDHKDTVSPEKTDNMKSTAQMNTSSSVLSTNRQLETAVSVRKRVIQMNNQHGDSIKNIKKQINLIKEKLLKNQA